MDEKIVLFGAGHQKNMAVRFIEKYGGFEVIEIWDNNADLWGKTEKICQREVPVQKPHGLAEHNIVVTSDIYYPEIEKQLREEIGIGRERIKGRNYLLKNFKKEILKKYNGISDPDIQGICTYLHDHELDMFNGQIKKEYPWDMFEIYQEGESGLLYSFWKSRKIFLSSGITNERGAKEYLCSLCREQDGNSPHAYRMDRLHFVKDSVVVDGGAAEGFFALQVIDKVKKIYLVEGDPKWVEALKYTFQPYGDKVVIIPKWLGSIDDEKTVSIDSIGEKDQITLIKLDIEGAENEAICGGEKTFSANSSMDVIICTYHRTEHADRFQSYFQRHGFDTSFSGGYMFVDGVEPVKPELRKGVLFAHRNCTSKRRCCSLTERIEGELNETACHMHTELQPD